MYSPRTKYKGSQQLKKFVLQLFAPTFDVQKSRSQEGIEPSSPKSDDHLRCMSVVRPLLAETANFHFKTMVYIFKFAPFGQESLEIVASHRVSLIC